jgi:hypothetical protein
MIQEAEKLVPRKPVSASAYLSDLLLAVPLLIRDGIEIRFFHKTVAEYFAAEYLAMAGLAGRMVLDLLTGPLKERFTESIDFLADVDPALYRRSVAAPIASAALQHMPGEPDKFWRTATFVFDLWIGIWPESQVIRNVGNSTHVYLPPTPVPTTMFIYLYGEYQMHPHVLAFGYNRSQVPAPAWQLISEPVANGGWTKSKALGLDFEGLVDVLPSERWYRLADNQIRELKSRVIGQAILAHFWTFNTSEIAENAVDVISDSRARTLLQEVEDEQRTNDWLAEMVRGSRSQ